MIVFRLTGRNILLESMRKILLTLVVLLGFISCKKYNVVPETLHWADTSVIIDTITIHEVKHEILRNAQGNKSILEHSPECWCLKKDSL